MAEIDQRSGIDRRGADGRSGIHTGFSLGRTALTGWALTAVLALAGYGTAMDATLVPATTPVPVADATPLGDVVHGSAPAVDPRTLLRVGRVISPVAVAEDTAPLPLNTGPMGTVTAASVPTPDVAAPADTVAAPGLTDLSVGGGTAPTTAATVPAGPAAQLRQAAFTSAAPDQRAALAIRTALAQIGLPYVWGGDGPTNGDAGFDCSGLTTFSYGTAGVLLPRTAHTQYNAGPHVPDGAALQPGDLVFYGTSARVHHVGMYLGAGRMVNAPTFGKPVQVAFYRYRGDDYLGATRPAAAGGSLTTGVLPYIDPVPAIPDVDLAPVQREQQAQDRVFQAPTASLPAVLPQPGDAALPSEQQSAAEAIAESDAVTGGRVAPRPFAAPAVVNPPAGDAPSGNAPSGNAPSGNGSAPVAGTTTSSSAPVTTSPVPAPASSSAPAGVTSSASTTTSAPVTTSPAGSATSATSTTSVPAAPTTESAGASSSGASSSGASSSTVQPTTTPSATTPATSSSAPVVVEKATGSTTATTTLAATSTVRTTTPKVTTSKVAAPVAARTTTTPSAVKTVTSPTTTAKAVTTTSKPVAKDEDDDDPTTTKTSASKTKTSKTKTSEETTEDKTSEDKTSEEKASATKSSAKKTSTEKTSEDKSSDEKSSSSDGDD